MYLLIIKTHYSIIPTGAPGRFDHLIVNCLACDTYRSLSASNWWPSGRLPHCIWGWHLYWGVPPLIDLVLELMDGLKLNHSRSNQLEEIHEWLHFNTHNALATSNAYLLKAAHHSMLCTDRLPFQSVLLWIAKAPHPRHSVLLKTNGQ